ncbi:hypothetical protein DL89DRAFT_294232 [Linderina pennispora]|uniref:Uncharacterized protein n=1 Tax=Linderina pennispora TaxID=61395 RepID=A0A1Y1W4D7_9FUNG|nr:uncharacterized protein DL89DRAFT_294232 [Linderina pennispora]ORX68337.1 hypothetical protein DL89DRAFT_294232 [Linderina pennispora]
MPSPLDVIVRQAEKARLSEAEQQALAKAQTRQRLLSIAGGAVGVGIGYLLSRRNKSLGMRGFMILFNGSFLFGLGNTYAFCAAGAWIQTTQSFGQTKPAQHTIDLRGLPPSLTPEERAQTQER